MEGVTIVKSYDSEVLVVKADSSVWSWTNTYKTPKKLTDGAKDAEINDRVMGYGNYGIVKMDGSLWTWGRRDDPSTMVKKMDNVVALSKSGNEIWALTSDGTLWIIDATMHYASTGEDKLYNAELIGNVMLPGGATATPTQPTPPPAAPVQPAAPQVPPTASGMTVSPTASEVYVNGVSRSFEAYNIAGSNYFKLRDLAYVINGTMKQFNVGYDNATQAITMTAGLPYTPAGGEMTIGDGSAKTATPTASRVYVNGAELNPTAYNIGGNNFFKLVDVMEALDIGVTYNETTRAISIDTNTGYMGVVTVSGEQTAQAPPAPVVTPAPTPPPAATAASAVVESYTTSIENGELGIFITVTDEMSVHDTQIATMDRRSDTASLESQVPLLVDQLLPGWKDGSGGVFGLKTRNLYYPLQDYMYGQRCNFLLITFDTDYQYVAHTVITVDIP
jgi:hypothetical protein